MVTLKTVSGICITRAKVLTKIVKRQCVDIGGQQNRTLTQRNLILARCTTQGEASLSTKKKPSIGIKRQVSIHNNVDSIALIVVAYMKALGVKKNMQQALIHLRSSVGRDNKIAQRLLGLCYPHDFGGIDKAIEWLARADNPPSLICAASI